MASRRRRRRVARACAAGAGLVLALASCTGSGTRHTPEIPDPRPGRVAAFDLGALSDTYRLDDTVVLNSSYVDSDGAGNVYLMNTDDSPTVPVLRMTPKGKVKEVVKLKGGRAYSGMAAAADGTLVIARDGGLNRVARDGSLTAVPTSHAFTRPDPIGVRPDGSVIVIDGPDVWSVHGGTATRLLTFGKDHTARIHGAVDAAGTVYVQSGSLAELRVLADGRAPRTVRVDGRLPASEGRLAATTPLDITAARDGGLYAVTEKVDTGGTTPAYVVHIASSGTATVLARATLGETSCKAPGQYPALDNRCAMPWYVVQSRDRVLALGGVPATGRPAVPALAIPTDTP